MMTMLNKLPSNSIPWIVLALSVATLGTAYIFQYGFGYEPCHLCLQERIPYFFAIGAAVIAGILSREANLGIAPVVFMGLCALAFAIGTVLSGYHAGVEYDWWKGPSNCTGGGLVADSLEALQQSLKSGVHAPRCDDAAWSIFGISLAGLNFFVSLFLAALSAIPVLRYLKEREGVA